MRDKAFVEITNICNLNCSFCAGHKRKLEYITPDRFEEVLKKLDKRVKYLYLHLMGEPLTHPYLKELLDIADRFDFRLMLTTNGVLLDKCADILLECNRLFKVSISVHAHEGNRGSVDGLDDYLNKAISFADRSSQKGVICVFRLWNIGAEDTLNAHIISRLHKHCKELGQVPAENRSGEKLYDKVFIEYGERFEWPDKDSINLLGKGCEEQDSFCYALRDQLGILVDGTVVPCCLDHDGELALGNIYTDDIDTVLNSPRARAIYDGFTRHRAVEKYCQTCKRAKPGIKV